MANDIHIPGVQGIESAKTILLPDGTELDKLYTNKKATRKEMLKAIDFLKERNLELAQQIVRAEKAIVMRCQMEGCRYGYKNYHKELKEVCIWCGQSKPKDKGKLIDTEKLRALNDKANK